MEMRRQKVNHRKYGAGTVIGLADRVVTVFFDQYGAHSFRYPDVFAGELKAADPETQRRIDEELKGE